MRANRSTATRDFIPYIPTAQAAQLGGYVPHAAARLWRWCTHQLRSYARTHAQPAADTVRTHVLAHAWLDETAPCASQQGKASGNLDQTVDPRRHCVATMWAAATYTRGAATAARRVQGAAACTFRPSRCGCRRCRHTSRTRPASTAAWRGRGRGTP